MDKLQDFLTKRKMFYIDIEHGIVRFPDGRHANMTSAEWLTDYNIPWANIIRGYYYEQEDETFIVIYTNNYEIPCCNVSVMIYLFHNFPKVKWIGLGAIKGNKGDVWEPQLKVYNQYI